MNATFVETTDNRLYFVRKADDPNLSHVWEGMEVKRISGGYAVKKNARPVLVRKAGARIIV
jgi:hypothetical protein